MNALSKIEKGLLIAAMVLVCGTASAQFRHYHGAIRGRMVHVTRIVTCPTISVNCQIGQKERLRMAVAYLNSNKFLTIKKYAKLTGLPKRTAEAELDAFSYDNRKPIVMVLKNKQKLYILRG